MAIERKCMCLNEVAEILGISRSMAYKSARAGQIPVKRIGTRLVVHIPTFNRWLEQSDGFTEVADAA